MKQRPHFEAEGSIELVAEANYANVDFFFTEERRRRQRSRVTGLLLVAAFFAAEWLIVWGAARAL